MRKNHLWAGAITILVVSAARSQAQSPIPLFDVEATATSNSRIAVVFSTRSAWNGTSVDIGYLPKASYSMRDQGWQRKSVSVSNIDSGKTRWRFTLPVKASSSGWVMVLIKDTSEYGVTETSYIACPFSTRSRFKRSKRHTGTRPGMIVPITLLDSEYACQAPTPSGVPGDVRLWTPQHLDDVVDFKYPYRLRFRQSSQSIWGPGGHWSPFELVPQMTKIPVEKRVHFLLKPTIQHGLYFVQCLERHVYTGKRYTSQVSGVIREF